MSGVTKRALTTVAVLAAASAPSTAYASLTLAPNADEQIVTARSASAASGPTGNAVVRPNPDDQTVADARTGGGPASEVIDNGGYGPAAGRPAFVRVAKPQGGFDWGDAGIGAAAGIGLAIFGLAGAVPLFQRRARRGGSSTAPIG
jgi:hypothetical protein